MKKPKQVFKFKDVIIAGIIADRVNKGYVKESNYKYDQESETYIPTSIANKNIMREILTQGTAARNELLLLGQLPLGATTKDFKLADQIVDHIEGLALKALTDELQGYEKSIYNVYETDEVTTFDFGLIASFPSSYKRGAKSEKLELQIGKLCSDSGYIGKAGDKIETDIKIVKHIFSRNYNSHIYTGITTDNELVSFWSQKSPEELVKVGKTMTVTAKIKNTSMSRFFPGIKETQLNYLKKVA